MKEQEKTTTRTVTETKTVYVAQDGEEFTDREQCMKYEDSAIFACRVRLGMRKLERRDGNEDAAESFNCARNGFFDLFNLGCDADLFLWTPKSEEEIKTFVQWWELVTGDRPLTRKELGDNMLYLDCPDELEVRTEYFVVCDPLNENVRVIDRTGLGNALEKMLDTLSYK